VLTKPREPHHLDFSRFTLHALLGHRKGKWNGSD
jgi:hypothetical protein